MRYSKLTLFLFFSFCVQVVFAQIKKDPNKTVKPSAESAILASYTQSQKDSYMVMNYTKVIPCKYMTNKEMEVIQYINVARMYPLWFIKFANLLNPQTPNEISLVYTLKTMKTIPEPLLADSIQWSNAKCHALTSGIDGYVGHDRRRNCTKSFFGECCDYGNDDALEIVKSLLIDEGVPSLGHRNICLDGAYKKMGVSIQPHKEYGVNAVLDFIY
jgi:hypothetical protein